MTAVAAPGGLAPPDSAGAGERRRADIQGLRALAVLLVIGIHAVGFPRAGFVGVDVFFVVSGFVITARLLGEADRTGSVSLVRFYARRFQRIAPAALVTLCVVVAAASLLPQPRRTSVYLDALWAALGAGNLRMILMPGERGGGFHFVSPVVHFWSLAVEEQFYLVWPLMLLLAWAVGRRRWGARRSVLAAALMGIAASLVIAAWGALADPRGAYYSPLPRGWEIGAGVLLAILVPQFEGLSRLRRTLLAFAGLAAIELSALAWPQEAYPLPAGLLPVAGAAALIMAGTGGTSLVNDILGTRVLRGIGDLSYSLYLWHFPVFFFMLVLQPSRIWDVLAESLVLTFVVAWLSYRFIEQPALRMFRSRSDPPRPAPLRTAAADELSIHGFMGSAARGE